MRKFLFVILIAAAIGIAADFYWNDGVYLASVRAKITDVIESVR